MKKMKFFALAYLFLLISNPIQAQEDKYKAIQGFGYLHTQVSMIISHWDHHPLNHKAIDDHEKKIQNHILNEMVHDEEWAEYMLVEGSLSHFDDHIDEKTQKTISESLAFYHSVLTTLKDPDVVKKNIEQWKKDLKNAEDKLYHTIYPALCK